MRISLPLLCVLCATAVQSTFFGRCLRKAPPPGVVVLSPGSKLVLTCRGHVTVNGVKVSLDSNSTNTNGRGSSSEATSTTANIISTSMKRDSQPTVEDSAGEGNQSNPAEAGATRSLGHTVCPTTHTVQPISARTQTKGEFKREAEEMDGEDDYEDEEEEGEEGSRVTRGIKSRPEWKWNGTTVGNGDRDWGEISFEKRGAALSLSSVRLADSGRYTCYYRGRQSFSVKVIVADPPERPNMSCYKKSPGSKIRCEWTPQKPVTLVPKCYLFFTKSPKEAFQRSLCSYSFRLSRCWCPLEHNENELRTIHMAYLCVTNIAGNTTSPLLYFTPMRILKPDPPAHVSVRQEEGEERRITVTWSFPTSWKSLDSFYNLKYEVKYKPLMSSSFQEQKCVTEEHSCTISDAMPGVEYLIQLRTKEEYDGQWSDWSAPVYASSWTDNNSLTAPLSVEPSIEDLDTMFPSYINMEGSRSGDIVDDDPPVEVPYLALWISGAFVFLSVILAAYLFRRRGRLMSKLQSVITQCGDPPQRPPSTPAAPEGQALMTYGPPRYKEPQSSKVAEGEDENGEQQAKEKTEAIHFNNTSYFFLQQW